MTPPRPPHSTFSSPRAPSTSPWARARRSLAALALWAGVCAAPGAAAAEPTSPFVGSVASFYAPPSGAPGAPGELIRFQLYTDEQGVVVSPRMYRVMYWSTMTRTREDVTSVYPVAASGVVSLPEFATMPSGGFPTFAFLHGTVGVLPKCGPSRAKLALRPWMLGTTFKTVAPDYVGLGVDVPWLRSSDATHQAAHPWYFGLVYITPFDQTSHPFVSSSAEARSTVDLVRASQSLEHVLADSGARARGAGSSPAFVAFGSSQGGHAGIATGELMEAGYAPELELLAIAAGAPSSEFDETTEIDPVLRDALFPLTMVGGSLEFLDISPAQEFKSVGKANYDRTSEQRCADLQWFVQNGLYSYPFHPEQEHLVRDVEGYQGFVDANSVGRRPMRTPTFVGQVEGDPLIWESRTTRMVEGFRRQPGADVTYCTYKGNNALDVVTKFDNHVDTTDRMVDGRDMKCTGPDALELRNGTTVKSFFHEHGFELP